MAITVIVIDALFLGPQSDSDSSLDLSVPGAVSCET
jgi:hypothetical protein